MIENSIPSLSLSNLVLPPNEERTSFEVYRGLKSLHRMRTCAGTWAPGTLLVGGETRAAVRRPASSLGSAAAPAESPPAAEFQHEPSHLTHNTCD